MDRVTFSNLALSLIGANQISGLSENSESAYLINQFHETAIRDVLSKYNWSCAITIETLVRGSDVDNMPAKYRFYKPADMCKILRVLDQYEEEIDYIKEGRYLYTNSENTTLKYIAYDEFMIGYPSELIEALAYSLATYLPLRLGKSPQLLAQVTQQSSLSLLEAMKRDRLDRKRIRKPSVSWGASRSSRRL